MPEKMNDEIALARAEAWEVVEEFEAEDSEDIDRLADGLMRSLKSYDQGPDFGQLVIKQLRLIARERRQGIA